MECHEEVTRKGYLEPCDRPAVAMRIDPQEGRPYPVCVKHTRAEMVPLQEWREAIAQEIENYVPVGRPYYGWHEMKRDAARIVRGGAA